MQGTSDFASVTTIFVRGEQMSQSFLIGQYINTSTFIHRIDPRAKIVSIFLLMFGFIGLSNLFQFVFATALVFTVIGVSKIPLRTIAKGLKPLILILSFTFLYNLFFTNGEVIWSWGIVKITVEGIDNAISFVWRIVLLVLLASVLTFTTKPLTLLKGVESLLKPLGKLGIPTKKFSLMLIIAIRFIPTIQEELHRILLAQKARGFDIAQLPLAKRLFAYIPIVVPLLFTTIQRADQLSEAIDARGYGDGENRTSYIVLQFQKLDYVTIAFSVVFVLLIMALKFV